MKNRVLFTFPGNVPELTALMNLFHTHYRLSWIPVSLKITHITHQEWWLAYKHRWMVYFL